jgi:DNA mismatch repair protein MutL
MAKKMVLAVLDGSMHVMDDAMAFKLAERACKAAIKAHDTLHDMEVMALLESLKDLNDPYTCPHGRPIIIRFALSEIERKFKRIL